MQSLFTRLFALFAGLVTVRAKRSYGRKRDSIDARDHRYVPSAEALKSLASGVDLRSQDGPIFDQGQLGSCTANGWLGLFMFVCKKMFGDTFLGSRLQLYYDSRVAEGTPNDDAGAEVRTGGKCLAEIGVAPENVWEYDISRFAEKPPAEVYTAAKDHMVVEYMRVDQDIDHMKACHKEGFPFTFGFEVYESFEGSAVARTGIMPMPADGERVVGGHCVVAIGYIDGQGKAQYFRTGDRLMHSISRFFGNIGHGLRSLTGLRLFRVTPPSNVIICRNSWGRRWGDNGYFYMPMEFIKNPSYASDFWTIRVVAHKKAA